MRGETDCAWYAVVTPLVYEMADGRYGELGKNPKTGSLLRVDQWVNGVPYAVVGKYGWLLKERAEEAAEKYGGKVIEVYSDDMFNNADIDWEEA